MGIWERSWTMTKTSFEVVRQDPELLLFPAISGFLSLIFAATMLVPTIITQLLSEVSFVFGPLEFVATFVTWFGLAFFTTFSSVCVVYTTRRRLEGGDATFGESISFAMSRLGPIAAWSLVSASVGMLLRALENSARNARGGARILLQIIRSMIGAAWTVVALFVVPAMVYDNLGPIDALKRSVEVLRHTWGESLVRHYGMGLATFVCVIPGALLVVGGALLLSVSATLGVICMVAGALVIGVVVYFFSVLNAVFNTALYHFATQQGQIPAGWDGSLLRGAFRGGQS